MKRHGRQIRLRDVGEDGQGRIARAKVRVLAPGLAGEVEARYLAGAGVAALVVADEQAARAARAVDATVKVSIEPPGDAPPPLPFEVHDPSARAVAEGAFRALASLRAALEGT